MDDQNNSFTPPGQNLTPNNTATHSRLPKRSLIAIGACLFIAVVVVVLLLSKNSNKQREPQPSNETVPARQPTISEQADKINFQGDYNGAQAFLDENIAKIDDSTGKAKLYETKALFALNAKHYQDSLQFAQKAEEINPTRNSAVLIGRSAEALGQKSLAIEYYQKVLDRSPPSTIEEDKQYYRDKIKALSG